MGEQWNAVVGVSGGLSDSLTALLELLRRPSGLLGCRKPRLSLKAQHDFRLFSKNNATLHNVLADLAHPFSATKEERGYTTVNLSRASHGP